MIQFDIAQARRLAVSSVGALLLSATCIAGAVAPARAAESTPTTTLPNAPLTVSDWQDAVGTQLNARLTLPAHALDHRDHLIAAVDVSFDRDGSFAGARIAQPSGNASVDRAVVRIASGIAYPPLPAGFRGRPQTVTLQAYFGEAASPLEMARHEDAARALANGAPAKHDTTQTAALPVG